MFYKLPKKNHIYRNVYHNLETPVVFSNDTIALVADGSSIFARTFIHFIVGWVESSRSVPADTILTISLNTWSCFTVVEKETERQFEDTKVVIRNCKSKDRQYNIENYGYG